MDKLLKQVNGFEPIYRVLNREENLNFFRDVLGMKVLSEENAQVFLGGHKAKERRVQLEESPGLRSVNGKKKHGLTVLQAEPKEIEQLLAGNLDKISKLYRGQKGYAFEAISPENDHFLLGSEAPEGLTEVEKTGLVFQKDEDFIGLSDFNLTHIEINVDNPATCDFLRELFSAGAEEDSFDLSVVKLKFNQVDSKENPDLNIENEETLDLEVLIFQVDQSADLSIFANKHQGSADVYLDKAQKTMALTAPNQLEIWVVK